jgi:hypothetical protein
VTALVFTVTAVTSVLGLVFPRVLEALERTPQGLDGDWWRLAPMTVLWWCGALLSIRWGAGPLLAGIAGAAAVQLLPGWAVPAGRVVAVAAAAAALALLAAADLHGAALAAGILIAVAARPFQRRGAAG